MTAQRSLVGFCVSILTAVSASFGGGPSAPAATLAPGQAPFNQPVACTPRADLDAQAKGIEFIQQHALSMLTPEDRAAVMASGVLDGVKRPRMNSSETTDVAATDLVPLGDAEYAVVRRILPREAFDRMLPVHQRALVKIMLDQADGLRVPVLCFAPGSDEATVEAFSRATNGPFNQRFQQGNRWSSTATNTASTTQGDRITLTYSFVPDGTTVPTLSAATASSNLFAFMNGIYGSPSVWQALYQQVLDRWSLLIGVSYVLEPNDDGVAINPNVSGGQGAIGVRGDCRFAGAALDGNFNVLAFNYFPSGGAGGDMVLDTADAYFTQSTSNNSRNLRNVLAHEHGHGLGMAHVCPINQTKLMEPSVGGTYDGPQFDDILNGQRHYGDPLEPNDTTATATVITNLDSSVRQVPQLLSIDDDSDVDVFRFTVPNAGTLIVTASPQGSTYLDGPQLSNGSCSTGTNFDALRVSALSLSGLNASGAPVGASPVVDAGTPATLTLVAPAAGTYSVRVAGAAVNNVQAYRLSYSLSNAPSLIVTAPSGLPDVVLSQATTTFPVQIQAVNTTLTPGGARLFYRYSGTIVLSTPLSGPDPATGLYTATLPPAPCDATPVYYVSVSAGTLTSSLPAAGAAGPRLAIVADPVVVFSDDFESDRGWSYAGPSDTATSGQWLRAVPVGTAAQPGAAFSPSQCAVTGNAAAGAAVGTNDIDNGFVTLTSPRLDFSNARRGRIGYARWFTNNAGANPNAKLFTVDVSADDGATWTRAETVGPTGTSASWIVSGFDVPASVPLTSTMRVRFIADDTGTGSLVEAALDDFSAIAFRCEPIQVVCRPDFSGNGVVDIDDIFVFLNAWFASDPRADFDGLGGVSIDDIFVFLNAWFAGC